MKRIAVLGSTGSVGINVLKVTRSLKRHFKVVGLASNTDIYTLKNQIEEFSPSLVAVHNINNSTPHIINVRKKTKILSGIQGIIDVATNKDVDLVVICISGTGALLPLIESIKSRKQIALANKEAIVMAGEIITNLCDKYKVKIIPIDSEHNAIFQCINGRGIRDVRRLILTGSGGPFNSTCKDKLKNVSPSRALRHPRWRMGRKITIDSATLMNKGLEVIEAHWLFKMPPDKIDVLIHPEAVIHSMVEYNDGSILGLFGITDMRLPIQYALTYPKRYSGKLTGIDFTKIGSLTFRKPDFAKFPSLELAYAALRKGKSVPCVLNAADEICVDAFLKGNIKFTQIPTVIRKVIKTHRPIVLDNLEKVFMADNWARVATKRIIERG